MLTLFVIAFFEPQIVPLARFPPSGRFSVCEKPVATFSHDALDRLEHRAVRQHLGGRWHIVFPMINLAFAVVLMLTFAVLYDEALARGRFRVLILFKETTFSKNNTRNHCVLQRI